MAKKVVNTRLSRSFHMTFKPERQYINALLRFAAAGEEGDYQRIADITGIPTGESSGKVPATIDYCIGMGLILMLGNKGSLKKPELTNLGRILLLEDPYLKLEISQWLCHLNMCNREFGADVWHHVFWTGYHSLGEAFSRENLDAMLRSIYGNTNRGLIGPLVSMYEDDASFKLCGALSESDQIISRKTAPIKDEMVRGYGAWLISACEQYFPKQKQVSVTEIEQKTGWLTIMGWMGRDLSTALDLMERKGIIKVDRHMNPWIISPLYSAKDAYKNMFNDMI
ncbi:MAG: hypothetical protein PHI70_09455 [Proteiniphilum sp.]|jgi:hypothetical protein|nr:hypothetical protein [Candidatus Cloacimonadota bacterium]MDD2247861.1 hypothetical protein [Proteiniphilum sp.]MDD3910061.1 hypothetical protein [Proteiniphilum sp.]MDD4416992.1 hypothetical protein [Proteiniphilum sp.]